MKSWIFSGLLLLALSASADPRSHYMIHCMGCHLMDGSGLPPDVPEFNHELAVLAATDAGRAYLVQVPGAAQAPVTDAALADVINWILKQYAPQSDTAPFTEAEVKRYRGTPLPDPLAAREQLMKAHH